MPALEDIAYIECNVIIIYKIEHFEDNAQICTTEKLYIHYVYIVYIIYIYYIYNIYISIYVNLYKYIYIYVLVCIILI